MNQDGIPAPHLPHTPTKSELLERYWYAFLKYQQAETSKRLKSGFGVPKMDFTEEAFWAWLVNERLDSETREAA